jgi:hypothetical protein
MYFLMTNHIKKNIEFEKLKPVINDHIRWTKEQISSGFIKQAGKWGEIGGMAIIEAENLSFAEKLISEDSLVKSKLIHHELDRFYPDVEI